MPSYPSAATRRTQRNAKAYRNSGWMRLLKAMLLAIGVTLVFILLFALLMQWLKPSDTAIRVVNQLIKLVAVFVGVWVYVGRGGENGLLRGALLGLLYMGVGVCLYALLSGQQLPFSAYLADLCMGVAGGGIAGALIGNMKK